MQEQEQEDGSEVEEPQEGDSADEESDSQASAGYHQTTPGSWPVLRNIVVNINLVRENIVDFLLISSGVSSPIELGEINQLRAFINIINPLIALGLYWMGQDRRWHMFTFVENQTNAVGYYDTPPQFFDFIRYFEINHPLDLHHVGPGQAAQNATNYYGLSMTMIRRLTNHLRPELRTVVHEFQFANDNLTAFLRANFTNQARFRYALWEVIEMVWMCNQNRWNVQVSVCLTDSVHPRLAGQVHDVRGVTNDMTVAFMMMRNLGHVYRFR